MPSSSWETSVAPSAAGRSLSSLSLSLSIYIYIYIYHDTYVRNQSRKGRVDTPYMRDRYLLQSTAKVIPKPLRVVIDIRSVV
jgi:hypothetical protein